MSGSSDDMTVEAVLLVDARGAAERLRACGLLAEGRVSVVSCDGTPAAQIDRWKRAIRAGARPPVLYLHDAATVLYPFTFEPLATLVACAAGEPIRFVDLGLPPLGAPARRFADLALPRDAPVLTLAAVTPQALARYAADAARALRFTRGGDRRRAP
ncbi:MAG TPA: hypothetical protein VGI39_23080 [Polyangiaceae bacterium]|jgi:hypothetical protein